MPTRDLVSADRHRLALGESAVEYLLVRRRGRRGVGLKVDEDGLTVSAPITMPLARIEALVRESERWVLRKVAARPVLRDPFGRQQGPKEGEMVEIGGEPVEEEALSLQG